MRQVNSQTKVIATLGPASSSKDILHQMINEGVAVFRLNFSHSTKEEHVRLINLIKS
jgi:pyruvate kinase